MFSTENFVCSGGNILFSGMGLADAVAWRAHSR